MTSAIFTTATALEYPKQRGHWKPARQAKKSENLVLLKDEEVTEKGWWDTLVVSYMETFHALHKGHGCSGRGQAQMLNLESV